MWQFNHVSFIKLLNRSGKMLPGFIIMLGGLCYSLFAAAGSDLPVVEHRLDVVLNPEQGRIDVVDHITFPEPLPDHNNGVTFVLHQGLSPVSLDEKVRLQFKQRIEGTVPLEAYTVTLPEGMRQMSLRYGGLIRHQLSSSPQDIGKPGQDTPGMISGDGVVLDGASGWYPYFSGTHQRFELKVTLPQHWLAISQGRGPDIETLGKTVQVGWNERQPQDDIYLLAAPFKLYRQSTPFGEAQVYLRQPDADMAGRYIKATARYLEMYSRLIGDYPYAKFALVENFWETGYGMPSFTLLGSRVIRLPFILHTSYPHEILHNWWGNSVYIDYQTGNWSEGLTAYLADHLLQESRGQGAAYRRGALKRYTEYADRERDFPLYRFRSRHGGASQAVGYDKSLMLFHMLRRELGDGLFVRGLQRFYRDNRFSVAGFADIRRAFEAVAGRDLCESFDQWIVRSGAPELQLGDVTVRRRENDYLLRFTLKQVQQEGLFTLDIPVAIQQQGRDKVFLKTVKHAAREQSYELALPARPLELAIDPAFDLFRRLDTAELPASLARLYAAKSLTLVLPSQAPLVLREAYRQMAAQWAQGQPHVTLLWDDALDVLPAEGAIWLLGKENRFLRQMSTTLTSQPVAIADDAVVIGQTRLPLNQYSVILTSSFNEAQPIAWLSAHQPIAVAGLSRKLPHYGKYSYLGFSGDAPDNMLKGQWDVSGSPLRRQLSGEGVALSLPARQSLIDALAPGYR